jgi:hypothetical protein
MPSQFTIGAPLPRAADAYTTHDKWTRWILASRGHGSEWARVLLAQPWDATAIRFGIAQAVRVAPIHSIRNREMHGIVCGVIVTIGLNSRIAPITTAWHYACPTDAPRLVSAYPTP